MSDLVDGIVALRDIARAKVQRCARGQRAPARYKVPPARMDLGEGRVRVRVRVRVGVRVRAACAAREDHGGGNPISTLPLPLTLPLTSLPALLERITEEVRG